MGAEFGNREAAERKHCAAYGERRDMFAQHNCGADHGHHGNHVYIHAGLDRPEALYGKIPRGKAHGRRPDPEEQQVQKVSRLGERLQFGRKTHGGNHGKHENEAVEKCAARNQYRVEAVATYLPYEHRINRPYECREEREGVAQRIEFKHPRPVEIYHGYAGDRARETDKKHATRPLGVQELPREHRGKERRD